MKYVGFKVEEDVWKHLKQIAKDQDRSTGALVRRIIKAWLKERAGEAEGSSQSIISRSSEG